MPPRDLTAEQHADWLAPSQAIQILDTAYPPKSGVSKTVLLERLRGGMVQAIAGHSVIEGRRERDLFYAIPSEDWQRVDTADILWITGELNYRRREYSSGEFTTIRHYNVRFEPQGIEDIVKSAPKLKSASEVEPENIKPETEAEYRKLPPVSQAHLKVWFELYSQVYGESPQDTLPNAYQSARGMFPGRFVSRERVRDLAGGRTRGRKPRQNNG